MHLKAITHHNLLDDHLIDLDKLKEDKLKEKDLFRAFKSILQYFLFLTLSIIVSYEMLDSNSFQYRNNLKNIFGDGDKSKNFTDVNLNSFLIYSRQNFNSKIQVQNINEIWKYTTNIIDLFQSQNNINERRLFKDNVSHLFGNVIIKQKRILKSNFKFQIF